MGYSTLLGQRLESQIDNAYCLFFWYLLMEVDLIDTKISYWSPVLTETIKFHKLEVTSSQIYKLNGFDDTVQQVKPH
jgi:hypothetical protein